MVISRVGKSRWGGGGAKGACAPPPPTSQQIGCNPIIFTVFYELVNGGAPRQKLTTSYVYQLVRLGSEDLFFFSPLLVSSFRWEVMTLFSNGAPPAKNPGSAPV